MGDLKPLGSEKLTGDSKLKRILELTYYQPTEDSKKSKEVVRESKTGVYGIVKEKDGYYVKKGLNENSLDYIGGLFMKNKNRFSSHGEAFKKLEFLTEQEKLQEATKYVLKQNKPLPKPQEEAPVPMPTGEPSAPAATPDPTSMDSADAGVPPSPEGDMGSEEPNANPESDYLKIIQKMTGRLTQKLSTYKDKIESKDIKYVINMVLAAVDLDKLEETDREEILSKFEDEEMGPEGETSDTGIPPQDEQSETDGMNALEELINNPFEDSDSVFDDDDDDIQSPDIEDDPRARRAAHHDIERETFDDEEDEKDPDEVDFNKFDDEDDQETDDTDEKVKELDIDELTNMVNGSVKDTLSKYFT